MNNEKKEKNKKSKRQFKADNIRRKKYYRCGVWDLWALSNRQVLNMDAKGILD